MPTSNRSAAKRALIAAAIAAAIGGSTVGVIAATDGGSQTGKSSSTAASTGAGQPALGGDLKVAVAYLGVPPAKLLNELQSGRTLAQVADATPGRSAAGLADRIVATRRTALAAAVRAGGLTAAQERTALATLRRRVRARVERAASYLPAAGRLARRSAAAAAAYLGLSPARLRSELRAGRTLAQLARATPGKSARGLIAAIVADTGTRLAASVAAGRITVAREKLLLANAARRVAAQVNGARR